MSRRGAASHRSVVVAAFAAAVAAGAACARPSRIPAALTDDEFRHALTAWSEPSGAFVHAGNLVSNETHFPDMIRLLGSTGGVYVGVGPEQNFSYIAGLRPEIAFIVDIRKENRDLHLLYKALFEVSGDRAEFLARLFSRERPAGPTPRPASPSCLPPSQRRAPRPRGVRPTSGWWQNGSTPTGWS
jgi:hypothetical protein